MGGTDQEAPGGEGLKGELVEVLITVLASKGLLTRDEVMREIKRLQAEMGEANN